MSGLSVGSSRHADASTTAQSVLAEAVQHEFQAASAWALSTGTHQRDDAVELVTAYRAARRTEGELERQACERRVERERAAARRVEAEETGGGRPFAA